MEEINQEADAEWEAWIQSGSGELCELPWPDLGVAITAKEEAAMFGAADGTEEAADGTKGAADGTTDVNAQGSTFTNINGGGNYSNNNEQDNVDTHSDESDDDDDDIAGILRLLNPSMDSMMQHLTRKT
uniref:Uncharacterized protein n=1 Tax=Anopheles atroparvus TaxID=41427 RepID=A0A182JGR9_ANOAO